MRPAGTGNEAVLPQAHELGNEHSQINLRPACSHAPARREER